MKLIKTIILISILTIMILFFLMNRQIISVHIIPSKIDIELPLFILIIINLLFGYISGKISGISKIIGYKYRERKLNKKIDILQNELSINKNIAEKIIDE